MRIHAIQTGQVAVKARQREGLGSGRRRFLNTLLDREWTEPLPIHCWLIEHEEGLTLVDTGETARCAEPGYFPRWHPYFRSGMRGWVEPADEVGPQIEALGFRVDDVRRVILTHLHTDHAGGLHYFPHADVLVTEAELRASRGLMGRARGYLNNRWPSWFAPLPIHFEPDPVGPFPESARLTGAGDVRIVPTPGHSPGHASVIAMENGVTTFMAGDASYTEGLMLRNAIDGIAPDEEAARETLRRINAYVSETPTVYLPSHDPDAGRRLRDEALAKQDRPKVEQLASAS